MCVITLINLSSYSFKIIVGMISSSHDLVWKSIIAHSTSDSDDLAMWPIRGPEKWSLQLSNQCRVGEMCLGMAWQWGENFD